MNKYDIITLGILGVSFIIPLATLMIQNDGALQHRFCKVRLNNAITMTNTPGEVWLEFEARPYWLPWVPQYFLIRRDDAAKCGLKEERKWRLVKESNRKLALKIIESYQQM